MSRRALFIPFFVLVLCLAVVAGSSSLNFSLTSLLTSGNAASRGDSSASFQHHNSAHGEGAVGGHSSASFQGGIGHTYTIPFGTLAVPPADPTNLSHSANTTTSITFTWDDNANNEDGYTVFDQFGTEIATLPADSDSYLLSGLTENEVGGIRVQAFNAYGTSAMIGPGYFYSSVHDVILADFGANATSQVSLEVVVTGTPPNPFSGSTGARIEIRELPSGTFSDLSDLPGVYSAVANGLTAGASYEVRVSLRNGDGDLAGSATKTVDLSVSPPQGPNIYDLTPTADSETTNLTPAISAYWEDPDGVDYTNAVVELDGTPVSATLFTDHFEFTLATDLTDGVHEVTVTVSDLDTPTANQSIATWEFTVITMPTTDELIRTNIDHDTATNLPSLQEAIRGTSPRGGGGGTVVLHNGEFAYAMEDLRIPGCKLDWAHIRYYHSQIGYDGPQGQNWDFNYNIRIGRFGSPGNWDNVVLFNGTGRRDEYVYDSGTGVFTSPHGFYDKLEVVGDIDTPTYGGTHYRITTRHGMKFEFEILNPDHDSNPGTPNKSDFLGYPETGATGASFHHVAHLTAIENRNGARLEFGYNDLDANGLLPSDTDRNPSPFHRLTICKDTYHREIAYRWNLDGTLREVEDFYGHGTKANGHPDNRKLTFTYYRGSDTGGSPRDLAAFTSPVVSGTSTGNDFLSGKTTTYFYLSGQADARLDHNLEKIVDPRRNDPNDPEFGSPPAGLPVSALGTPYLVNTYGTTASTDELDRVTMQSYGDSTVSVGGDFEFSYLTAADQTEEVDRNDNEELWSFAGDANSATANDATPTDRLERTSKGAADGIRAGEPDYTTTFVHNADTELIGMTPPEGQGETFAAHPTPGVTGNWQIQFAYQSDNRPTGDGLNRGNLLTEIRYPDDRGLGHDLAGNTYTELKTTYFYESNFNFVQTVIPPRGNWAAGFGSDPVCFQYNFTYDGQGNLVCIFYPQFDYEEFGGPPPNTTGPSLPTCIEYNECGLPTQKTDPDGSVDRYFYHAFNPGDTPSTGSLGPIDATDPVEKQLFTGYLGEVVLDEAEIASTSTYTVDFVGNRVALKDPRGVAYAYEVNALNQTVKSVRAAAIDLTGRESDPLSLTAHAYFVETHFDANDNVREVRIENRDDRRDPDPGVTLERSSNFDILDNLVRYTEEVGGGLNLETEYLYDPNENVNAILSPLATSGADANNRVDNTYDERDLLFETTRGGAATEATTRTMNYDGNRNRVEVVDAVDHDSDGDGSGDDDLFAGAFVSRTASDKMDYVATPPATPRKAVYNEPENDFSSFYFDGFDRYVGSIDGVGNVSRNHLDPHGNVRRSEYFGEAIQLGDSTPGNDPHELLSDVIYEFDCWDRLYQVESRFFTYGNGSASELDTINNPVVLKASEFFTQDTDSTFTVIEPDVMRRTISVINDNKHETTWAFDGLDRPTVITDAAGNSVETFFDDNSNVIETVSHEWEWDPLSKSVVPGSEEVFYTSLFYDSLNRLVFSADNDGHTRATSYDSTDNPTERTDANGSTVGGPALTRRSPGAPVMPATNSSGNKVLLTVDGIHRQVRTDYVLSDNGLGDGAAATTATRDIDNPASAKDEFISVVSTWDANSNLIVQKDDNGNVTSSLFDSLNRPTTTTFEDGTTKVRVFDKDHNVTSMTDNNGSVITSSFDALNRVFNKSIARATGLTEGAVTYSVVGTSAQTFTWDGLSRMTFASDDNDPATTADDVHTRFGYTSLSHRTLDETTVDPAGTPFVQATKTRVDGLGNPVQTTYPSLDALGGNANLFRGFDFLERLTSISYSDSTNAVNSTSYTYVGPGRVRFRDYFAFGDFIRKEVVYDNVKRVTAIDHYFWDDLGEVRSGDLEKYTYTWDREFNRQSEGNVLTFGGLGTSSGDAFSYDSAYRVTDNQEGLPLDGSQNPDLNGAFAARYQNGFDGPNNFTSRTVDRSDAASKEVNFNGATSGDPLGGAINEMNEYAAVDDGGTPLTRVHSKNGNLLDDTKLSLRYDVFNRLRTATNVGSGLLVGTYLYDAMNRRVRKSVTNSGPLNGTTDYAHEGDRCIEEYFDAGGGDWLKQRYIHGVWIDELLTAVVDSDEEGAPTYAIEDHLYYHDNIQGSVRRVSTYDNFGLAWGELERYEYEFKGAARALNIANGDWESVAEVSGSTVFTDSDANWPVNGLALMNLNPDASGQALYSIVSNTATTITISGTGLGLNGDEEFYVIDGSYSNLPSTTVNNRWGWQGRYADAETGLYYFRNRYYDADTGRFIQRDSIGLFTDEGNFGNGYSFCGNSWPGSADPYGMNDEDAFARPDSFDIERDGLKEDAFIPETSTPPTTSNRPLDAEVASQLVKQTAVRAKSMKWRRLKGITEDFVYRSPSSSTMAGAEDIGANRFGPNGQDVQNLASTATGYEPLARNERKNPTTNVNTPENVKVLKDYYCDSIDFGPVDPLATYSPLFGKKLGYAERIRMAGRFVGRINQVFHKEGYWGAWEYDEQEAWFLFVWDYVGFDVDYWTERGKADRLDEFFGKSWRSREPFDYLQKFVRENGGADPKKFVAPKQEE